MTRILVIEDEEVVREMLLSVLTAAGYEVEQAQNGLQGINLFSDRPSELVIADILMPKMDGLETIRELRHIKPDLKIIAMSAGGVLQAEYALGLAQQLGSYRTLRKPFKVEVLLAVVKEALAA